MFIKVYQYLNFIRPLNLLISLFTVMISVNLIAPQSSMETTFPIYMVVGLFLILGNIITRVSIYYFKYSKYRGI